MRAMLAYKNWRVFTHVALHWGPLQYSSWQAFKAPLPSRPRQIVEEKKLKEPAEVSNKEEDEAYFSDQKHSGLYNNNVWECIECYLNLPDAPHLDKNPLNHAHICQLQQQDEQLLAQQVIYPDNYVNLQLDDDVDDSICYQKDPTQTNWKIELPKSMVIDTAKWFLQVMGYPGEKRWHEMLNQCYHHPKLCYHIDKLMCKGVFVNVVCHIFDHKG
jgi:hypothetical protein